MAIHRHKSRCKPHENPELEMTPMIDVVFQLLIFFIVTLKPEDILSHLDVSRPMAQPPPDEIKVDELLKIYVYDKGYSLKGRRIELDSLARRLTRIASYDRNTAVIIQCTANSPHSNLVKLLNVCADAGLENISVFSL